RIAGKQRARTRGRAGGSARRHRGKDAREFRARQAVRNVREPRQRPEREHVSLSAVAHGRVTVAARDLLAFDRAIYVALRRRVTRRACVTRTDIRRLRIVVRGNRVSDRAGWTLHPERLREYRCCEGAQKSEEDPTACLKHKRLQPVPPAGGAW